MGSRFDQRGEYVCVDRKKTTEVRCEMLGLGMSGWTLGFGRDVERFTLVTSRGACMEFNSLTTVENWKLKAAGTKLYYSRRLS